MPQVSSPAAGTNISSTWADEVADAINGMFPVGHVITGFFTTDPADYLILDGRELSRTGDYAALYAAVGPYGGAGDGVNTWTLPNMANRVPMAPGPSPSIGLGATGGSKDAVAVSHNHTQNAHTHTQTSHNHSQNGHNHAQNPHAHAVDGDYGFRLGITVLSANDALVASGTAGSTQAMTYTDIDDETAVNQAATATNVAATAANNNATAANNAAGVSGTDANLPPYLALQFAVKYR